MALELDYRSMFHTTSEILSERNLEIERLQKIIKQMQVDLTHEMEVNDHLNDENIKYKGQIREAREVLKLRVLPSSMDHLQRKNELLEQRLVVADKSLKLAIDLIPNTGLNREFLKDLRNAHGQVRECV